MDILKMLGGVRINKPGKAIFSRMNPYICTVIKIEKPDFSTIFYDRTRVLTVSGKWSGDQPPNNLMNRVPEYPVFINILQDYKHELQTWLDSGWLLSYPEKELDLPKDLIPLMGFLQQNKNKVCPVLDFHELNGHVTAYTYHADICVQKLR